MSSRYVIIGAGVAGISALEAIRKQDPQGDITVVYEDPYGFYSRPALAFYLTSEVPETQLYPFDKSVYQKLGAKWVNSKVQRIHVQEHVLDLNIPGRLVYDKLLLATGSRAVHPKLPGIELNGVVKIDGLEDAKTILKGINRARAAVVVGGGITSLELVEAFAVHHIKTHFILRASRVWDVVLDELESRIVEEHLKNEGVEIHPKTELGEISGKKGKVEAVVTKDGQVIKCQMVAIGIGVQPQLELAQQSGLKTDRGILVNEYLQTSHPDIYAAGDVAQVFDPLTGKATLDVLWNIARMQGRTAGMNMAGSSSHYLKGVPFNVTRLAGIRTTIIGMVGQSKDVDTVFISRGDSETWRQFPDAVMAENNNKVDHLRLILGKQAFLGAVIMGKQELSTPLQELISSRADITPIREVLMEPGAPLDEIVMQFYDQWKEENDRAA